MKRSLLASTTLALAVLVPLAACSSSAPDTDQPSAGQSSADQPSADAAAPAGSPDLSTAKTDLGEIIVDGSGMTVYYFTADTPGSGKSACADDCLTAWPSVHPAGAEPAVDGVTADVATITGTDGEPQLTVDGRPVYTFAGDTAAGATAGQGLDGAWFVVAPDGSEISTPAGTESPAAGY